MQLTPSVQRMGRVELLSASITDHGLKLKGAINARFSNLQCVGLGFLRPPLSLVLQVVQVGGEFPMPLLMAEEQGFPFCSWLFWQVSL